MALPGDTGVWKLHRRGASPALDLQKKPRLGGVVFLGMWHPVGWHFLLSPGDSDLGGREAKARLCGASPPWQPSGSCVSPIPEAQVLEECCPLVWALQGQDRVTGILLGFILPRLPSWSFLRGQSTGFAAEVDVTHVLDQGTSLSFPPVPVPLMGRSDPSLYLLGESERGGCGVVAWWGWGTCLPSEPHGRPL